MIKPPIKVNISDLAQDQQLLLAQVYHSKNRTQTYNDLFGIVECRGGYIVEFENVNNHLSEEEGQPIITGGLLVFIFDSEEEDVVIRMTRFRRVEEEAEVVVED